MRIMRYYQSWQDYSRRPEVKQLIETKGMSFAQAQYQREVNYMEWNDPVIINETNQPGMSVFNPADQGMNDANSTQFITGYSKETSTFTFATGLAVGFTGSANPTSASIHGTGFDVWAYDNTTDYSLGHVNSIKKIRLLITTGSGTTFDDFGRAACVITASTVDGGAAPDQLIIDRFKDAINNQSATAQVAGFTNTFAPSDLISGSDTSPLVLTITREYNASVPNASIFAGPTTINLADTASVATPVEGQDTYYYDQGMNVFNGTYSPWNAMPRK